MKNDVILQQATKPSLPLNQGGSSQSASGLWSPSKALISNSNLKAAVLTEYTGPVRVPKGGNNAREGGKVVSCSNIDLKTGATGVPTFAS